MNPRRRLPLLTYLLCLMALGTLRAQPTSPIPANLAVATYGNVGLELSWTDNTSNETGFEVHSSSDNRTFTKLADVPAHTGIGKMNYTLTGLSENTLYYLKVRAKVGTAFTDFSNTINPRTLAHSAPNDLKLTVKNPNWIQLGWTDIVKEGTYEVERRTGQSGRWSKIGESGAGYDDKTASESTEYCYRVRLTGSSAIDVYPYSNAPCITTTSSKPPAPTGLSAQVISSYQIDLAWTPSTGSYDGTEVEYSANNSNFQKYGSTIRPGTNRQSVTGLSPNTRYWFRVRATNGTGTPSDYSNTVDATTNPEIPVTPTGLTVSVISSTKLQPYWNDSNVIPVTYSLERAEGQGGAYKEIASGYMSKIYNDDQGLNPSTQYCYRVRAKSNSGGYSNYSTPGCNTTQAPPVTVPRDPTNLKAATKSSTEIDLTWTDNSDNETRFELQRSLTGNDPWENVDTNIQPNSVNKTDGGRNPSTRYYYRIRAVVVTQSGASLYSNWSNPANDITQAPPVIVPTPPTNLKAEAVSASQINLSWTVTNSTFGDGYVIEQASPQGGTYKAVAEVSGRATSTFSVTGLTASTQYCFRLRTKYTTNSDVSNEACQTTQAPPVTIPRPPSNLKAEAQSSTAIRVTWDDNSDNESEFELWWATSQTASFTRLTNVPGNTREYLHTGLTASSQYCYQVRAINSAGQSAFAGPQCTNTQAPPLTAPAPPTDFAANATSISSINLVWKDNSTNETGFELQFSLTNADPWTGLPSQASNVTTFTHPGLTANTRYYYRLRAVNGTLASAWITANATTPALPLPSTTADLKAEVVDYDQVKLTWGAITNTPTGIVIERSTSSTSGFTSVTQLAGTATTFTDTGLPELTTFYYRIRATNANGQSGNSNVASAKTPESIISVRPQPLPEGIYAHVDHGTLFVTLNWSQFQEAQLRFIGLNGREQITDQCRINGGTLFQYGVAHLPAGVYVLCLDTDKNRFTKKIWIP